MSVCVCFVFLDEAVIIECACIFYFRREREQRIGQKQEEKAKERQQAARNKVRIRNS